MDSCFRRNDRQDKTDRSIDISFKEDWIPAFAGMTDNKINEHIKINEQIEMSFLRKQESR
ncbi:hypothetical protein [Candidatus Magnetominusculus dajiuhuensis]|uniref:hypothetical protein n=1 Tax=Candidatus Magnetominusculus dajiuhuensis TaxID=3137712 RepID=UPI003B43B4C1